MSNYEKTFSSEGRTRFSAGLMPEIEDSVVRVDPQVLTTFNAGDIVPIGCWEVLPRHGFDISLDGVIRQTTVQTPTMGSMEVEFLAFFVPHRVVNLSAKSVFGENVYDAWAASEVSFAPLYNGTTAVQVPVGSVADYYDFPTQAPIPASILQQCNDLKFRGYVEIYNQYFRDQNYQPPIPYSKLNVHEGFFQSNRVSHFNPLTGTINTTTVSVGSDVSPDNAVGSGSVVQSVFGNAVRTNGSSFGSIDLASTFNALNKPLKANKIHDYFTSVLPQPQKSQNPVFIPVTGSLDSLRVTTSNNISSSVAPALIWRTNLGGLVPSNQPIYVGNTSGQTVVNSTSGTPGPTLELQPANLVTEAGAVVNGLEITINDLRQAAATQQVYEALGRCGSRYREYVRAFFGLEVDDPFKDIPQLLGKFTRTLDLYQTAQTSASIEGETEQGHLAAYGYTALGGHLFTDMFYEHGYLHVFAVVRHRNIYPSFMPKDVFRRNLLDFYQAPMANIGNQPVFGYEINPFSSDPNQVFGYKEAFAEYRFFPDRVTGLMRTGVNGSIAVWNYADPYQSNLNVASSAWLQSNSQEVLDRSLAVTSSLAPQFKAQICFHIKDHLPMPTYSVPGLDII